VPMCTSGVPSEKDPELKKKLLQTHLGNGTKQVAFYVNPAKYRFNAPIYRFCHAVHHCLFCKVFDGRVGGGRINSESRY
jgi:hypothetical protein